MQAAGDVFREWTQTKEHDYYLGQFRDMKISAEVEAFPALWLRTHHVRLVRGASPIPKLAMRQCSPDTSDRPISSTPWRNTRKRTATKRKVPLRPFRRPFVPGPADGTRTGSRSGLPAIAEMRMSRT